MKNITTAHVLFAILILIIGIAIGTRWNTKPASVPASTTNFPEAGAANLKAKCQQYGDGTCSFRGIEVPCSACSDRGLL